MKVLALITDVDDMPFIRNSLNEHFKVKYAPNCNIDQFYQEMYDANIIYTNPNNSRFALNRDCLAKLKNLETVVTASTGTVHIDLDYCREADIKVICIKDELSTLRRISSTAEHAVLLTLTLLRRTHLSMPDVWDGNWDYTDYIGRQVNCTKIGSVGYGRLGTIYLDIMHAMGAECSFHDPYVDEYPDHICKKSLRALFKECDVVAIHCHVTAETRNLIDLDILENARTSVIINTARGEIVNFEDLITWLKNDKNRYYGTDVLPEEQDSENRNKLLTALKAVKKQVAITPHQGGMTFDARKIAYERALQLLFASEDIPYNN